MADHHTIIRNSVCLCVCLLANRIIKWTMIHHRQVMGIQTFSSYSPPPIIYLCPFCVLISAELSFCLCLIYALPLKLATHTVIPHSSSIRSHFSLQFLASLTPLSFCLLLCVSLTLLLSLPLSSLHRYPNAFILPPLLFIQFVCLPGAVSIFFSPNCPLSFLSPPSAHYYLTAMLLYLICQPWCFHILLAYGELSLLYRSHQYLYRLVNPIRSKQMVSFHEVLMKVFSSE